MDLVSSWVLPSIVAFSIAGPAACAQSSAAAIPDLAYLQQIEKEDFDPAIGKQIRQALETARNKPHDAEAAGRLGMILQCYGKYEPAEVCYLRARGLAPRSFRWAYYLGNVQSWLGKNLEAVENIREALRIDPGYAPARVRLGQLLFESGDLQESMKAYEESLRQNPHLGSAYFGIARVLAARGNWAQATESYHRACEISPDDAAARYALAMAYKKTGDESKAREQLAIYQSVRESSQPSEDPLMNEVKSLYRGALSDFAKASSLVREGKNKAAIAEFESALRVNPRMVMAHIDLIALYGNLGDKDKAERHFREAVATDPAWPEAYYNWGLVLLRSQSTAEAAKAFATTLEVNPHYADANIQLGSLLDAAGEPIKAQKHFRLALEDRPSSREAQFQLGRILIRNGEWNEAIDLLAQTIAVDDDKTPVCLQTLAVAHQRAGHLEEAVKYLEQARQQALLRQMNQLAQQLREQLDLVLREASVR